MTIARAALGLTVAVTAGLENLVRSGD